jgi:hypothetical protein
LVPIAIRLIVIRQCSAPRSRIAATASSAAADVLDQPRSHRRSMKSALAI